jgi:thiosulfate/3-mercaptopyruvate sulfurtransferase
MAAFPALIGVDELAGHSGDPAWRIFDCRHDLRDADHGARAYAEAHIPGALHLNLDRDLSGPQSGHNGRHPLPDPAVFAATMAACGVAGETVVIAYDDAGGMFAARLWWLLRWLGHQRVALLDGGLAAWRRAGQALDAHLPRHAAAQFSGRPAAAMSVDAATVLARLHAPDMLLVDARSAERFRGEGETLDPVGGHIPGAVNRCFADNLDADKCAFKPAAVLRDEFLQLLGGRDPREVVHQCGSGVTACHNLLAMELAGLPGGRLYAGSWSEWCSDPSRPVAR